MAETDFLIAMPSFIEGIARILDLGGTLAEYNISDTPKQADTLATYADWVMVGRDIETAVREFGEEEVVNL